MSDKNKPKRPVIILIITILLIMFLGGGSIYYFSLTIISPLIIIIPAAALGFLSAYVLRKKVCRLSGNGNSLINTLVAGTLFSSLFIFGFLCANYSLKGNGLHKEVVTVERLYYKTRHRTRRLGRRYVANGEPYNVYYMEIAFTNGNKKEIYLGQKGYKGYRSGRSIELEIETGALGIPVIKS
ncbi:MAG: hypothetical protein K2M01_04355, partial [Paramuribaculum sp.]|nr:hypothetical protein [Paramuribaculum sp.]